MGTKISVSPEWCLEMALREGDAEVGAGVRHDYLVHETIEALLRCPLCAAQVLVALPAGAAVPVPPAGPEIERATREGVNAARDLWVDGAEFDDAVACGIGVAFGLVGKDAPGCTCITVIPGAHDVDCPTRAVSPGAPPAARRAPTDAMIDAPTKNELALQRQLEALHAAATVAVREFAYLYRSEESDEALAARGIDDELAYRALRAALAAAPVPPQEER